MKSLFNTTGRSYRTSRNVGFGLAFLLTIAGMSAVAADSSEVTALQANAQHGKNTAKVPDKVPDKVTVAEVQTAVGKLPLAFEANRGQTDAPVKFMARAKGYTAFLTQDNVTLRMKGPANTDAFMVMRMVNGQTSGNLTPSDKQIGISNYLLGNDRSKWLTNLTHYGKVTQSQIYKGIDVAYWGTDSQLEYDFVVAAGADPKQIRVAYDGADSIALNANGDLELKTIVGVTVAHKPVVYQMIGGKRQIVDAGYVLSAKNEVGFRIGSYNTAQPLVIDPVVTGLSYVGGTGNDQGLGVAAVLTNSSATGAQVFITGKTNSAAAVLPTAGFVYSAPCKTVYNNGCTGTGNGYLNAAPYQGVEQGGYDCFVTGLNKTGTNLVYSTYIGGTDDDVCTGIATDGAGNAYVTGYTNSLIATLPLLAFPTTAVSEAIPPGAGVLGFVAELNGTGSTLTYSSLIGGPGGQTQSYAIALGPAGSACPNCAYIGGSVSATLSVTPTPSTHFNGGRLEGGDDDAFIARFDKNGNLTYQAYVGGSNDEQVNGVAVDSFGNAFYVGTTSSIFSLTNPPVNSIPFPTSPGAYTTGATSGTVGFAIKVPFTEFAGGALTGYYGTTFGGDSRGVGHETATGVAVDPNLAVTVCSYLINPAPSCDTGLGLYNAGGNMVYVVGNTTSDSFNGAPGATTPPPSFGSAPPFLLRSAGYLLGITSATPPVVCNSPSNVLPLCNFSTPVIPGSELAFIGYTSTNSFGMTPTTDEPTTTYNAVTVDAYSQIYVVGNEQLTGGGTCNCTVATLSRFQLNTPDVPAVDAWTQIGVTTTIGGLTRGSETVGNAISVTSGHQAFVVGTTAAATGLEVLTPGFPSYIGATGISVPATPAVPNLGTTYGGGIEDAFIAGVQYQDIVAMPLNLTWSVSQEAPPPTNVFYVTAQYLTGAGPGGVPPAGTPPSAPVACNTTNPFSYDNGVTGNHDFLPFDVDMEPYTPGDLIETYMVSVDQNPFVTAQPGDQSAVLRISGNPSNCADNSALVNLQLLVNAPLNASPAVTGLTEVWNSGIITGPGITIPAVPTPGFVVTVPVLVRSGGGNIPFTTSVVLPNALFAAHDPNCTLISFDSTATNTATQSGVQVDVNVHPYCYNDDTPLGVYAATILFTPNDPTLPAVSVPFSLTVVGGATFLDGTGHVFSFQNNAAATELQALTIQVAGGPFQYLATYIPATASPTVTPLPVGNVSISPFTGTINTNGSANMLIGVSPVGLIPGVTYTGIVYVNPTASSATFSTIAYFITAEVGAYGNQLFVYSPSTSVIKLRLPAGFTGDISRPQFNPYFSIGGTSNVPGGGITINGPNFPTVPAGGSVGVAVTSNSPWLEIHYNDGQCYTDAFDPSPVRHCAYQAEIDTTFLAPGTHVFGTITVTGNDAPFPTTTVTVDLTVTGAPSFSVVATPTPPQPGTTIPSLAGPLYQWIPSITDPNTGSVVFTPAIGTAFNFCTITDFDSPYNLSGPVLSLESNAGVLNNTTITSSVPWLSAVTVTGGNTVPNGSPYAVDTSIHHNKLLICVTPGLAGTATGNLTGYLTIQNLNTSPIADNSGVQIPVTLVTGTTNNSAVDLPNIGVFRSGLFYEDTDTTTYNYSASHTVIATFGLAGDIPVAGDWQGSGVVTIGVFRPSTGAWYFDLNADGTYEPNEGPFYFGLPGDKPVVGDWTGLPSTSPRSTKIGVFRNGVWYLNTVALPLGSAPGTTSVLPGSSLYNPANTLVYNFGLPGDQPVASNWNQTKGGSYPGGPDFIGIFRNGTWIVDNVGDGVYRASDPVYNFGTAGDIAVVGDWSATGGPKRIGVFRPSQAVWYLDVNGSNAAAPNDIQAQFGISTDLPVVGRWQ